MLNARPPLPGAVLPLLVRYADTAEEKQRKAAKKERMARGEKQQNELVTKRMLSRKA